MPCQTGPFKRPAAYERWPLVGQNHKKKGRMYNQRTSTIDNDLVGDSCEVTILINNIPANALLDTGSTVSTISREFYDEHFSSTPIQELKTLLQIECAVGENLPYDGYIEASIHMNGLPQHEAQNCLLLVVPNNNYNHSVPCLLGTNILNHFMNVCKADYGCKFLQNADLHTPWYLAFRSMTLHEKILKKRKQQTRYHLQRRGIKYISAAKQQISHQGLYR